MELSPLLGVGYDLLSLLLGGGGCFNCLELSLLPGFGYDLLGLLLGGSGCFG